MSVFHFALHAILHGPTFQRAVSGRDVLAAHLDWARRTRGDSRPAPREDESPWDEAGASLEEGAESAPEGEPKALEPEEVLVSLAEAAVELDRMWREDVLGNAPSRLLFGLCGVADRGAFLLEPVAPDLASRFERLRDLLMGHSQDGKPVSDEELGLAVDELEALIPAVAGRARELHAKLASQWA